ncbi:MAG: hypothetical protein AAF577_11330 [Pseudomonadota bacterium]
MKRAASPSSTAQVARAAKQPPVASAKLHSTTEKLAVRQRAIMENAYGVAQSGQIAASVQTKLRGLGRYGQRPGNGAVDGNDPADQGTEGLFDDGSSNDAAASDGLAAGERLALRNKMLSSVKEAVDTFRISAHFAEITIFAAAATGPTGCLQGPGLSALISAAPSASGLSGARLEFREAVAAGVGAAFDKWRSGVMVPGLPWYPAFTAYPGPQAPPTPNVPVPLAVCPSAYAAEITVGSKVAARIKNALPDAIDDSETRALCDNVGNCVAAAASAWLITQTVSNVLGHGPVPTFAPPAVPTGPVVGGSVLPTPCLTAGGGFPVIAGPL